MPHSGHTYEDYLDRLDRIDAQHTVFTWRREWKRESLCIQCPEFMHWMENSDEEIEKYVQHVMSDEDFTEQEKKELTLKLKNP